MLQHNCGLVAHAVLCGSGSEKVATVILAAIILTNLSTLTDKAVEETGSAVVT